MHKSRLILLCVIVLVLAGARTAKAQDGVASLEDQIQNKYSEREPDKSATTHQKDKAQPKNNDDGHRKHWWSLPHFRHKKKDENATTRLKTQPKRHTVTASSQAKSKTAAQKHLASQKHVARTNAPTERSKRKTLTTAKPSNQTVAQSKASTASAGRAQKNSVATGGHAREIHQNCSSAEVKKGSRQSLQKHNTKAATRSS